MTSANLYLDEINFLKYLDKTDCACCGFSSCKEFADFLKSGKKNPHECTEINRNTAYAFEIVQKMGQLWPEVPLLLHPRPASAGLVELNNPNENSPVLISGNNEYTEEILLTVLGTTISPFFVIFVDTDGNTVDMAMIFKTLSAERISKSLKETGIDKKVSAKEMIIPGLAASLKNDIETLTGWRVRVGPKCAAELPLFLSGIWVPPV